MKFFLSCFLSQNSWASKEENEDSSAKKQDKNEGKTVGESWLPRYHVTIRPRSGRISSRIRGSGEIQFFSKTPANPAKNLAKNWPILTVHQKFPFFFFRVSHSPCSLVFPDFIYFRRVSIRID